MTFLRSIEQAEKRKELDRNTWASLDQISYMFDMQGEGEAIAGPFMFGRAFDAPPWFTVSFVTADADTSSGDCVHLSRSSFITMDQHVALHGRGPFETEIPRYLLVASSYTYIPEYPVLSLGTRSFPGGPAQYDYLENRVSYPTYATDRPWHQIQIVTTDPPPGEKYHIWRPSGSPSCVVPLIWGGCFRYVVRGNPEEGEGNWLVYSSVVSPGETVTVSAVSKVDTTTGTPRMHMGHNFWRQDGSWMGQELPPLSGYALSTSYERYEFSVTVPEGAYWWLTSVGWFGATADPNWYVGDIQFSRDGTGLNSTTAVGATVGVSEWIQDEKGMYIGAMLWCRGQGLSDITAQDFIEDGFESLASIPEWDDDYSHIWAWTSTIETATVEISTTSPYEGVKHGRLTVENTGSSSTLIWVVGSDPGVTLGAFNYPSAGEVTPGDIVEFEAYVSVVTIGPAPVGSDAVMDAGVQIRFFDSDGTQIAVGANTTDVNELDEGQGYLRVYGAAITPSGAKYVSVNIRFAVDTGQGAGEDPPAIIDFDGGRYALGLKGGAAPPTQVRVLFQGETLKNYDNIRPTQSKSSPTVVVLE